MQIKHKILGALIALITTPMSLAAHGTQYVVTDLGTLGGSNSAAFGINDRGDVVGNSYTTGTSNSHAFLYSNSMLTDLGTLGGPQSFATSINSFGWIVGQTQIIGNDTTTYGHAFWQAGSVMTDLGSLAGHDHNSTATGVNTSGQIVGSTDITGGHTHAFLYANGTMSDLGTLGGDTSAAFGINSAGTIVGSAQVNATTYHAFAYYSGTMHDLGTLGGLTSTANALNDSGLVVGDSMTATGDMHAFSYSASVMHDLSTLGGHKSHANAVNASGQIVGASEYLNNTTATYAFIYNGSSMVNLNTLIPADSHWVLQAAFGINASGQIVGAGDHSGALHAFLLTPIITAAPNPVTTSNITPTQVTLSWPSVPGATNYRVFRSSSPGTFHSYIGSTNTPTTSFTNIALQPSTYYYYIIVATNSAGSGPKSSEVGATTLATVPEPLSNLTATAVSRSQINLSWTAATFATGYEVFRSSTSMTYHTYIGETTGTNFSSTGLAAGTPYYYIVVPKNSTGKGPKSPEVTATTFNLPSAPTNVVATAVSASQINLTWTAAAGATTYYVFRGPASDQYHTYIGSTTTTSFNNTGLAASTAYYYIIVGVNASGQGPKSAEVGATTFAP